MTIYYSCVGICACQIMGAKAEAVRLSDRHKCCNLLKCYHKVQKVRAIFVSWQTS